MLNLGLIGLGGWGKRLVESVQGKSETVRFVSAVTGTPARHQGFVARYGLKIDANLAAMLADPNIHDTERAELEAFAAAVMGERTYPVPLADAVHGVAVIEAMDTSARTGRPVAP